MKQRHYFYTLLFIAINSYSYSQNSSIKEYELPWITHIGGQEYANKIQSINAKANVRVSDGLTYGVHTLFQDHQRAVFKRIYSDKAITQAIEGKYYWTFDEKTESESPAFIGNIILGHQFYAQLLFFNRLHPEFETIENDEFDGNICKSVGSKNENSSTKIFYYESAVPLGMEIVTSDETVIIFKFDDWQKLEDLFLPFSVFIDDGSRTFEYQFTDVNLNTGSISDFHAPENLLTDEQKIMRKHRTIMDGHFFGKMTGMEKFAGDTTTIVSRGEIFQNKGSKSVERLNKMLTTTDYKIYDDLVRPIIKISDDGSLAWAIVQIYANGNSFNEANNIFEPLEFVCAWIELYEKSNNDWKLIGNVSNFKED